MKKMYFTSKKSFLVEQNPDGTLLITKTSTMKPLENAGSFIVSQGGIEAILSKCKEVTDEEFLEDRKQLLLRNEQAKHRSQELALALANASVTKMITKLYSTAARLRQRWRIYAHFCAISTTSTGEYGSFRR